MSARLDMPPPEPVSGEDRFPVSFAQARLWFLEQLEQAGTAYHVRLPVRLDGALDVAILQRALDVVVARHESLRTRIATVGGGPQQVIIPELRVPLEVVDVAGRDEAAIAACVTELSEQPFDIATGPLLRAWLLRESPTRHQLLLVTHHIVSDAWSSGVLFKDLASAYNALLEGHQPQLPELPVQYADYAVWQREWLDGDGLARQLDWWRGHLSGAPALLQLPTDRPRPAQQSYRGSRWTHEFDPALTRQLETFARGESATLFMLLLAGYVALLARYSGQRDLVVGTPVAGRTRAELEGLIGFFANTLALRFGIDGEPGLREWLARVRHVALSAFGHQELPFEKLVEALQPARQLSHAPLFQVMFILQNTPWDAQPLKGLAVSPGELAPGHTSKYDLTLSAANYDGRLWLSFEYNTDLFDAETVAGFAAAYEQLLRAAMAEPDKPLAQLPLTAAPGREGALAEWNATATSYPRDARLFELLAARAAQCPAAIAVEDEGGERWTYAQLHERAATIAEHLRAAGAARNVPVALCVERGAAMLAALLGILRSGAAYLPLDPDYPPARLADMLSDSGTALLITDSAERFADFAGTVLVVDTHGTVAGTHRGHRSPAAIDAPESLAYLIYTSGSTGRPKAVLVPQRAVVNFLHSLAAEPGLTAADCWLAVTTLSFDIAALELLLPLLAGARVVIAARATASDGQVLAQLMQAREVTVMQATPSGWRVLLNAGWAGQAGLKILCGGEALDPALASALASRGAGVWNLYGPTETTIWSTLTRVTNAGLITIGRPIANTQVWICDANLSMQPIGVPGELCIGGDGVALGYLGNDQLTAERFVPDPFSDVPGARLYRTGDRARWRADGELELLGRLDQQVKLRGFRIELGEIEAALAACAGVSAAAAGLREPTPGAPQLVAWVVPSADPPEAMALRAELAQRLPDYMLPTQWVELSALPLTPNGKLDRQALPAPDWSAVAPGRAPATPREAAICEVFGAVLGRSGVSADADFFALGGHSLLATQLISRLREVLGLELPLRAVFEQPTPAGLARRAEHAAPALPSPLAATPSPASAQALRAPASDMQRRLWFVEQLRPGSSVYNLAWTVRLEGRLDRAALQTAVNGLLARHAALRTAIVAQDGEPLQVIASTLAVSVDWQSITTQTRDATLASFVSRPFDLASPPLWRVGVLAQSTHSQVLVVVIHHIIADGWSLGILFRELGELYAAALAGRPARLAALPLQYADFARWQRSALAGPELSRQLEHWRQVLDQAPVALPLPTDRPRPPVQGHRGARVGRHFDRRLLDRVHAVCRAEKVTPFMLLLGVCQALLTRWTGAEDLVVGTPVAGRGRREFEGLVGFFVNTLPLRGDLSGNPDLTALLARIRHTALAAFEHPDLPFERLVEALNVPRDTRTTPLFQVLFNLHNEPGGSLQLPGLVSASQAVDRATAKFALSWSLHEQADGLSLLCEYDTELFDESTVSQLLDAYGSLLDQWLAEPTRKLGDLQARVGPALPLAPGDLVEPDARQSGPTASATAPPTTLPTFARCPDAWTAFASQASAAPSRLAIASAGYRWSYGALAEHACRVAQAVVAAGPGERVGLLAEHDAPLVAGLLGIAQAGRAWVTLDPAQPLARLAALAASAGVSALVTDAPNRALADQLANELADELAHRSPKEPFQAVALPVVTLDTPADARQTPAVAVPIEPDQPAYLLHTSGTTGRPKAVVQSHAGLLRQTARFAASLGLGPEDRLSWLSRAGFDAGVQDIFAALLSGASLHPLDLRNGADAGVQVDALVQAGVTVVHATPTVYRDLFGSELSCRHELGGIRAVVLGGESARRSDFALFCTRFARGTRFVNGYGLTESSLAAQWQADHDSRVAGDMLPLGEPAAGLDIRLEDAQGQASWQGEIVLRGPGLALGYWDANRTQERLVAFHDEYRTGDIGRRGLDGQLYFVGRRDDQVKLRGVRLSLGELEATLAATPGVNECAVILRGEQLTAYVAGELAAAQRTALERLAPWQRPGAWVSLAALPKRPNGKLDRDALPAPARPAGLPPRGELEARLAALWSELLKVPAIHREDDFFALGGHSLLATRLIARIRQTIGVEISLLSLFENPSIAGLARAIEACGVVEDSEATPGLRRQARTASQQQPDDPATGE